MNLKKMSLVALLMSVESLAGFDMKKTSLHCDLDSKKIRLLAPLMSRDAKVDLKMMNLLVQVMSTKVLTDLNLMMSLLVLLLMSLEALGDFYSLN